MTKFAVKNPVSVLVTAVLLLLAGYVSLNSLPRESFPEIKIPLIFVNTVYPGAAPEDIEKLITEKIEDQLDGVDGVKKITSQSMESVSAIQIEFNTDVEVEDALRRVRDKVEMAKGDLPTDAEDPMVQELNFSNIPIFIISLTSDAGLERLEPIAEDLRERIQAIPGVLEAKVTGKQDKEIAIDVDPAKLASHDVGLGQVAGAIQEQHRNIPGGGLRAAGNRFTIKVTGELSDPEEFGDVVVRSENGKTVRVRDVATVGFQYVRDRSTISRLDGQPSLAITVTKRTGENIIEIVDESKKVIEEHSKEWPRGTLADYSFDQSTEIRHMVNELANHIILGLFLVVGLLSFFLGFRNSFFISTAIPFSMMLGFIVLDMMGVTLNMVVLFSLVIALGMLVDDGIVVVENIYRHMAMGKSRAQAAIDGTTEVALPVATATLTTISAFLPILWMPGIMGNFMKYLPITVSVTLAGSLFVAFVFNPVFSSLFMTSDPKHHDDEGGSLFQRFKGFYGSTLENFLHHPWIIVAGCMGFVVSGVVAYGTMGRGVVFFPNMEPQVVAAEIEGPLGMDVYQTDSALKKLEAVALSIPDSLADVVSVTAVTGKGKSDDMAAGGVSESNKGYLDFKFEQYEDRKVSSWKTMAWLNDTLPKVLPGWNVKVKQQQEGPPQGKPVEYEIAGDDYKVIAHTADSVVARLKTIPELVNVTSNYNPAQPEIRVVVDREQAKNLGVSTTAVAMAIRSAMFGIEAGKYRVGKDEHKVMVRLDVDTREQLDALSQVMVDAGEGKKVPLSSVATWSQDASLAAINRLDRTRTVKVTAELRPGQKDESGPKAKAVEVMSSMRAPDGVRIATGSGNREQEETAAFLVKAMGIAVGLVFLTMVFQFNSIFQPLLILLGVFLALGGVFWGLLITGWLSTALEMITLGSLTLPDPTFSILMTGIGIIALAGVVAKNGIVLIDFMNHLRAEGRPLREVAIEGGKTRLRPVMLTAITAMIGMVPMATGMGIDFVHQEIVLKSGTSLWWAPMAWAIFWGLLFNTALVLVVTPVLYYAWYNWLDERKARKLARLGQQPAALGGFAAHADD
jgi:multidrug efflux pump